MSSLQPGSAGAGSAVTPLASEGVCFASIVPDQEIPTFVRQNPPEQRSRQRSNSGSKMLPQGGNVANASLAGGGMGPDRSGRGKKFGLWLARSWRARSSVQKRVIAGLLVIAIGYFAIPRDAWRKFISRVPLRRPTADSAVAAKQSGATAKAGSAVDSIAADSAANAASELARAIARKHFAKAVSSAEELKRILIGKRGDEPATVQQQLDQYKVLIFAQLDSAMGGVSSTSNAEIKARYYALASNFWAKPSALEQVSFDTATTLALDLAAAARDSAAVVAEPAASADSANASLGQPAKPVVVAKRANKVKACAVYACAQSKRQRKVLGKVPKTVIVQ